eukprot:GHVU01012772.1.p2 GENE.GHVU01012772.1~~GHVU01012772.1.p2  ORF type:complete len:107 (+),score=2.53 GHVU01012772.1:526-846(+)
MYNATTPRVLSRVHKGFRSRAGCQAHVVVPNALQEECRREHPKRERTKQRQGRAPIHALDQSVYDACRQLVASLRTPTMTSTSRIGLKLRGVPIGGLAYEHGTKMQ